MISIFERKNTIHIIAHERLSNEDYEKIIPLLKQSMSHLDTCNLIIQMKNYQGEKIQSFWNELKFDLRNVKHIQKIALVGEDDWKISMKNVLRPFIDSKINFFEEPLVEVAKAWVNNLKVKQLDLVEA